MRLPTYILKKQDARVGQRYDVLLDDGKDGQRIGQVYTIGDKWFAAFEDGRTSKVGAWNLPEKCADKLVEVYMTPDAPVTPAPMQDAIDRANAEILNATRVPADMLDPDPDTLSAGILRPATAPTMTALPTDGTGKTTFGTPVAPAGYEPLDPAVFVHVKQRTGGLVAVYYGDIMIGHLTWDMTAHRWSPDNHRPLRARYELLEDSALELFQTVYGGRKHDEYLRLRNQTGLALVMPDVSDPIVYRTTENGNRVLQASASGLRFGGIKYDTDDTWRIVGHDLAPNGTRITHASQDEAGWSLYAKKFGDQALRDHLASQTAQHERVAPPAPVVVQAPVDPLVMHARNPTLTLTLAQALDLLPASAKVEDLDYVFRPVADLRECLDARWAGMLVEVRLGRDDKSGRFCLSTNDRYRMTTKTLRFQAS